MFLAAVSCWQLSVMNYSVHTSRPRRVLPSEHDKGTAKQGAQRTPWGGGRWVPRVAGGGYRGRGGGTMVGLGTVAKLAWACVPVS